MRDFADAERPVDRRVRRVLPCHAGRRRLPAAERVRGLVRQRRASTTTRWTELVSALPRCRAAAASRTEGNGSVTETTVVHLMRHGEVYNPTGVLYGRISRLPPVRARPEDGRAGRRAPGRAATSCTWSARRWSGPRRRWSRSPRPSGCPVTTDERVIEAANLFEGKKFAVGAARSRNPSAWWCLRNPVKPTWGEPYQRDRAADAGRDRGPPGEAAGHEALIVSHQLPIWIARCDIEGRRLLARPAQAAVHAGQPDLVHLRGQPGDLGRYGSRRLSCCEPTRARSSSPVHSAADTSSSPARQVGAGGRRLGGGPAHRHRMHRDDNPDPPVGSGQGYIGGRPAAHPDAAGPAPSGTEVSGAGPGRRRTVSSAATPARSWCSTSGARGARPAARRLRTCRRPASRPRAGAVHRDQHQGPRPGPGRGVRPGDGSPTRASTTPTASPARVRRRPAAERDPVDADDRQAGPDGRAGARHDLAEVTLVAIDRRRGGRQVTDGRA